MNVYLLSLLLILNLSLTACTLGAHIWTDDQGSIESSEYPFDTSHLDFSGMVKGAYSTSVQQDELQVQLNMQEYVYQNKVKFVNLPDGAQLACEGASPNAALQTLDLSSEKSFSLKPNFWVATDTEWQELQSLRFSCWYEVSAGRSAKIHFEVQLQELKVARVSVPPYTGVERHGASEEGVISADGRFVVFRTKIPYDKTDLNNQLDVYVRNLQTQEVRRVSVSHDGSETNGDSETPTISADGRYIAFESAASNLVLGDTNNRTDIFVRDMTLSTTKRVSVHSDGSQSNDISYGAFISADGGAVSFLSYASNLIAADTNSTHDIFVHEMATSTTTRVSVASGGGQVNGSSSNGTLSSDGRYVVFSSQGTNLAAGDSNNRTDVFIHDRQSSTTELVSVSSAGLQADGDSYTPSVSGDGRYVSFRSFGTNLVAADTNGLSDIFLRDRNDGTTKRVSVSGDGTQSNGHSYNPSLSQDGNWLAYDTRATNIVAGDTNGSTDVILYKISNGEVRLISRNNQGDLGNDYSGIASISADGRFVAMESYASNFIDGGNNFAGGIFVWDAQDSKVSYTSFQDFGGEGDSYSLRPILSDDGRYVCFESYASNFVPGDTNGGSDIFVHDRKSGGTKRVSVSSAGAQADGEAFVCAMSGDGRYVAFASYADNLVPGDTNGSEDIFVHDLKTQTTTRVSVDSLGAQPNSYSYSPSMSKDGRYIAFDSAASNLVAGDTNGVSDVFVHDQQTGETKRVSVSSAGAQASGHSFRPSISADGRYIAYSSAATDLVAGDTNMQMDVFVYDQQTASTTRVSLSSLGAQGNLDSDRTVISGNGRYVAFESAATNLSVGDGNAQVDIFVHDTLTGLTTLISQANGVGANSSSARISLDHSGRYIAFQSNASNLVTGDTNSGPDLFVFDQDTGGLVRVSVSESGLQGDEGSYSPSISADGRYVAGSCYASNLIPGDSNENDDIFIFKWR
ncbi:hypothetical protein [Bdellovibrio bacteriovorus]|uniref:hypothetical protein n=1 Tax=Bdellovibrio bacteriovorus TaxID=959 RepID=UPI003D081B16